MAAKRSTRYDYYEAIFIDSDAFIALAKPDDSNRDRAQRIYQRLSTEPVKFITSNYVFAEVVTVLSQRVGHEAAVEFMYTLTSPETPFTIIPSDEHIETTARAIFAAQTSKNVSYVDCVNMAIAKTRSIEVFFSFDRAYIKNRFRLATA